MKRKARLTAAALALLTALWALPASALALSSEDRPEETASPADEPLYNGPEDSLFTTDLRIVYNNGGTVYNNGATVYNNAGLVYNNGGLVYNNGGTVYSNGGTVYNNAGQVHSNGATVYGDGAEEEPAEAPETAETPENAEDNEGIRVRFAEDYSAFAQLEGLEEDPGGDGWLLREETGLIRPREGFSILRAESSAGSLEPDGEGGYVLKDLDSSAFVALAFQPDAPQFSPEPGTYGEKQYVELSGPAGAAIYFTEDGSEPEPGKGRYTGPITVTEGAVIKAIAVAEGAEPSETAEAAYAVVRLEAPELVSQTRGYRNLVGKPITLFNPGPTDAHIQRAELTGDNADCFQLGSTAGRRIAGTDSGNFWTVQPREGLAEGTYTAAVVFTTDSGARLEAAVSFTVEAPKEKD